MKCVTIAQFDPASMDWELAGDLGKIWFKHVVIPLPDDLDLGCPGKAVLPDHLLNCT